MFFDRADRTRDKEDVEILVNGERAMDGTNITMGGNASETIRLCVRIRNLSSISTVTMSSCAPCYDIPAVILTGSGCPLQIPPKGSLHPYLLLLVAL